jgi:hypothetical protein
MKRYATLCRIGHWCWLEAECETKPAEGLEDDDTALEDCEHIDHDVEFRLINAFGDRFHMGSAIITQCPGGDFWCETRTPINGDHDGETFPSLEAAMLSVAADMVAVSATPFDWREEPARHKTCRGVEATAFDR